MAWRREPEVFHDLGEGDGGIRKPFVDKLCFLLEHPRVRGDVERFGEFFLELADILASEICQVLNGVATQEVLDHKLLEVDFFSQKRSQKPAEILRGVVSGDDKKDFLKLHREDVVASESCFIQFYDAVDCATEGLIDGQGRKLMLTRGKWFELVDGVSSAELGRFIEGKRTDTDVIRIGRHLEIRVRTEEKETGITARVSRRQIKPT